MTDYIQKRIEADRATLRAETDPAWRARIEDGIAFRQRLLEIIANVGERQPENLPEAPEPPPYVLLEASDIPSPDGAHPGHNGGDGSGLGARLELASPRPI